MIQITVTGTRLTVVADTDISEREWKQIIRENRLGHRHIELVDYTIEDYPAEPPLQQWTFEFADAHTTVELTA